MTMTDVKIAVLYHRGCADGTAAAWAAHFLLGDTATYTPYQYGDPFPEVALGKHVVLVDLSLKEEVILDLTNSGKVLSILVVDHHKVAIDDLQYFPTVVSWDDYQHKIHSNQGKYYVHLDIKKSGCVLTWEFFHRAAPVPKMLEYIQDYDLWKHEFPESKAVVTYIMSQRLRVEDFYDLMDRAGKPKPICLEVGQMLLDQDARLIDGVVKTYCQRINVGDDDVILINSPHHLRNEVAESLKGECDYVVCYTEREGKTIYSLRSNSKDTTPITLRNGGGGHRLAGAYSVSHDKDDHYRHSIHLSDRKPPFLKRLRRAWRVLTGKTW